MTLEALARRSESMLNAKMDRTRGPGAISLASVLQLRECLQILAKDKVGDKFRNYVELRAMKEADMGK